MPLPSFLSVEIIAMEETKHPPVTFTHRPWQPCSTHWPFERRPLTCLLQVVFHPKNAWISSGQIIHWFMLNGDGSKPQNETILFSKHQLGPSLAITSWFDKLHGGWSADTCCRIFAYLTRLLSEFPHTSTSSSPSYFPCSPRKTCTNFETFQAAFIGVEAYLC